MLELGSSPRWFIIQLMQQGKLKRLPRVLIVDMNNLSIGCFITQLRQICVFSIRR